MAKVTVSKANLNVFFVLLGPAPFFVASLFCFEAKRKSGCGICGSFLVVVVLLFFVCRWFRDDLPKFLDHTCPCTFLLFTAYAIVRTEPSANRPNRRKKNTWSGRAKHSYGHLLFLDLDEGVHDVQRLQITNPQIIPHWGSDVKDLLRVLSWVSFDLLRST